MKTILLDNSRNIEIDLDGSPLRNVHALSFLRAGLFYLASTVRHQEILISRCDPHLEIQSMDPSFEWAVTSCAFFWFSTSLVNYMRLVGLVGLTNQKGWEAKDILERSRAAEIKRYCDQYVEEVIPAVLHWRNKVAAHFAITHPYGEDNVATLESSIMDQLIFIKPYFRVAAAKWCTKHEESTLPSWALTQVFEELAPRFWNELILEKLDIPKRAKSK